MKYQIKNPTEKTSSKGTKYVSATMVDEAGKEFTGVNAFNGEFATDTWYGELEQNGKFWNLITPKKSTGNNFMAAKKEESIAKFQDKKEQSIAAAQDRSAWMWAKNNAATLLASDTGRMTGKSNVEIAERVVHLATLIYNGEPTEPFSSPVRPSEQLSGLSKVNQQAAEKFFATGLTDDELHSMKEMEF